jgi:predicted nucleic acid-binding protein
VVNGLRKRVVQHVLTVEDACAALDAIAHLELTFVGGAGRWFQCLPAALEWGITAYDALYVLLARDFDAVLVTADERLHTATTGTPVQLLGH